MARFSDEWIELVKSSTDIVEVIGRRVQLKQSGRNFVGLCPFHDEKTPSFSVNQEKQFYHCFGCNTGGNVINFIMETEHLSFPEAVTKLAEEKGITVPTLSVQDSKIEKERQQLREINELAARYYYRNLRLVAGKGARAYLEKRGINEKLAREFYLGYALEDWDGLARFFQTEGVDLASAQEAGLLSRSQQGYIDRFRGRIIFPICDHIGRFIGFGGRSIKTGQPKYLNTTQTAVFNKSSVLYGLNWSKEEIKKQDQVIIVEGYTDLISLFAAGKKNVVASLGTAFTVSHAKLMARFGSNAVIAFDGDAAGQKATLRSMEILYENDIQVRIATLQANEDPDTFVRNSSKKEIEQWLSSAKPFREYQIDRIISQHDVETREGKLTASTELVTVLANLRNSIERDEYIRYGAHVLGISENSLFSEVNQKIGTGLSKSVQNKDSITNVPLVESTTGGELVEREAIRCLLRNPAILQDFQQGGINASDFQNSDYRHLFDLITHNRADQRGTVILDRLYSLAELTGSWEDYFQSFLLVLRKRRLQKIEEKLSSLENDRKGFDIRMELYRLLKEYYDILRAEF